MCIRNCILIVYTGGRLMPSVRGASRDVTINLRANRKQRALIDRAAEALGKNRSDFMLEVACREADAVLLDQRLFLLDEKAYRRFNDALDGRPTVPLGLRRLLASRPPWEA